MDGAVDETICLMGCGSGACQCVAVCGWMFSWHMKADRDGAEAFVWNE